MPDEPDEQEQTEPAADDTAAETDEVTDDAAAEDTTESQENADGDKPPEGKTAEFNEAQAKSKIHKANQEARRLRERLKALEPLAAKAKALEDAQKTDTERLAGQLAEAEKRVDQMRARAVRSEVRALAAASFADQTDPEALLDLTAYVSDDGDIDTAQITADLAELLERKPHLGKPKPEPERRRPAPDRTQASGANRPRSQDPADEFAGFVKTRLKLGR